VGEAAWPPDGKRVATLKLFGDTPEIKVDFMRARLDAFITTLNLVERLAPQR